MTMAGLRNGLRMLNRMERAGRKILPASRPLALALTFTGRRLTEDTLWRPPPASRASCGVSTRT